MTRKHTELSIDERYFNCAYAGLAKRGVDRADSHVLSTREHGSRRSSSSPEDIGADCLVAPRSKTQWLINARTAAEVTLAVRAKRKSYRLAETENDAKAPILQFYLQRFESCVNRFFGASANASMASFEAITANHPVFMLNITT